MSGETLQPKEQDVYSDRVDMAIQAIIEFSDIHYNDDYTYLSDLAHNPNDPELEFLFRKVAVHAYPDYSDDLDVWHPQARGLYFGFLLGAELSDTLADRFDRILVRDSLKNSLENVEVDTLEHYVTSIAAKHAASIGEAMQSLSNINYAEDEYERQAFTDGVCFVLAYLTYVWERGRMNTDRQRLNELFAEDLRALADPAVTIDASHFENIL